MSHEPKLQQMVLSTCVKGRQHKLPGNLVQFLTLRNSYSHFPSIYKQVIVPETQKVNKCPIYLKES